MTTHCNCNGNLIPSGNDFYLAIALKSRSLVDGEVVETPFDFEAADTYNARIYSILDGKTLSTMVGLKDGSTDTVIIDAKGVPLIRAIGVEVTGEVDGRAFRAAEKGFLSIVEFNGEAKVVFTPVTGGQEANLVMTLTFLPSAAVVGKNAYEIWKEEPGNQDKTLADFIYFLGHGESAYEIAVRYGYTGTEAEYNMLYFDAVDVANTAGQNAQQAADTANEMAAQAQDAAELADAATANANNAATAAAATVDAAIDNMEDTMNAAIAAQDAEIDEQFATQTALINQKQMEIGAVPSDLTPTPNSTNWVTSGGLFDILGSIAYDTKLISDDFSTNGMYKIDGNNLVLLDSENWKCKIVPIDELSNTNAVGVAENKVGVDGTSDIPPIIYLSGSSPVWSNFIGKQYGTIATALDFFTRLATLNIPLGATHAIINNQMSFGADSTVTYKSGTSIRDDVNQLGDEVENIQDVIGTAIYDTKLISNDFSTNGYYKIDNNSLIFAESANWLCKIVDVSTLYNTNAIGVRSDWASQEVQNIPPIIYLSGASPVWSNYIGCEYGTQQIQGDTYNKFRRITSINIPSNATHAIINCLILYTNDSTITYKYGTSIKDNIEHLENRFVFVDKNGNGNFTTISAAVGGTQDGDTIIVNSGTYEEDVHMWGKERHIVGVCRETCILTNGTGNYQTPPLEANIGSVENMTIVADNYAPTIADPTQNQVLPSYGIHVEYANPTPYKLTIRNCRIVSKWCAGMGIGLRYNQTLEIIDSDLISEAVRIYSSFAGHWVEMGGLFFHNDNSNNVSGTGILIVRNCRIQGKKAALIMEAVNKTTMVDAEFECNTFISEDYGVGEGIIYRYDNMVTQEGYLCGNKITLGIASHGNNIEELNA